MMDSKETSKYCSVEEIPLFLDANDIVRILGVSKTNVYYMFRADGFPTISMLIFISKFSFSEIGFILFIKNILFVSSFIIDFNGFEFISIGLSL